MTSNVWQSAALAVAVASAGCSGGQVGAVPAAVSSSSIAETAQRSVSLSALPLDDSNYTAAGPKVGWVYSCQSSFTGGGSSVDGPWIDLADGTWNSLKKIAVEGSVKWRPALADAISGTTRKLTGNGLPSHTTGVYPIRSTDPAYRYDRNPNSIRAQSVSDGFPANPAVAAEPSCLNMGPIGVMLTGAQLYNALDALGRDAPAHELLDACNGHPDQSGTYHYHSYSKCMSDPGTGHSALLGFAADGFGIYGLRGTGGKVLADADLDACHGHTHAITWNGKTVVMYHYHFTNEYPYSLGCYKGTPAVVRPGPPGAP